MHALFSLIANQSLPQSSSAHHGQKCARSQKRKHWFREQDNHMTFGVASFAPERSEGANDATRDTNKLYARQKSCDYHYYQYIRPNRTNLFHKRRMFYMKSGSISSPHFAVWPAKRSVLESVTEGFSISNDLNTERELGALTTG